MPEIWLIFKGFRRRDWASPPDPKDANTASSQRLAPLGKGATLSFAAQTTDISRYWRQRRAGIECGP